MLTLPAAFRVSLLLWTAKADAVYAHLMECFGKGWADGLEAAALPSSDEAASMPPVSSEPTVVQLSLWVAHADDYGNEPGRFVPVVERELGGRSQLSVAARHVCVFVGSARGFTKWFEEQCAAGRLREGVDYAEEVLGNYAQNPFGGRPRKDFILTLNAAKEIGMLDDGACGKERRLYFLECERRMADGVGATHSPTALLTSSVPSEPAAAASPSAASSSAASPSVVSAGTIPLTLTAYLDLRGFRLTSVRGVSRSVVESGGPRGLDGALVRKLLADPPRPRPAAGTQRLPSGSSRALPSTRGGRRTGATSCSPASSAERGGAIPRRSGPMLAAGPGKPARRREAAGTRQPRSWGILEARFRAACRAGGAYRSGEVVASRSTEGQVVPES